MDQELILLSNVVHVKIIVLFITLVPLALMLHLFVMLMRFVMIIIAQDFAKMMVTVHKIGKLAYKENALIIA